MLYHEIEELIKPTIKQVERKLSEYMYEKGLGLHVLAGYEFNFSARYNEPSEIWKIILTPKNLCTDYHFEVTSMPWNPSEIDISKLGNALLDLINSEKNKYVEEIGANYLIIDYKGEMADWETVGD